MQLHELKPIHKAKKIQRVGRGGKRGTYSGKGVKGQRQRSGRKMMPIIREIIKRYPKLRGYRYGGQINNLVVLNLDVLEKRFEPGSVVNPESLRKLGIVRNIKGRVPAVKILGSGELKKPLTIEGCRVSKSAREAVEKCGGKVK